MGSLLLAAGQKGPHFALPNACILVHQPKGGFEGQATDVMLHAQEILNLKKRLNEIYMKHTGQLLQKIEEALERDFFMTAEKADTICCGSIDAINNASECTDHTNVNAIVASNSLMRPATTRPSMSVGPPAANGMTMVIGRSGNFWALACELSASTVAAKVTSRFICQPGLRNAQTVSG